MFLQPVKDSGDRILSKSFAWSDEVGLERLKRYFVIIVIVYPAIPAG